ncbi:hypothetical protein FP2506_12094 [Fulvimarina pelagi HTCC2506]|uniref:Transposase n=1 Tax=Fulvimarina pelagi HTCC2506 TaxID=314231 RepID=Q0G1S7_9HYPH|nr:hypothetical protein FP2506_12094 [Fulvimarina pelagi HTCC2506]
MPNLKAKDGGIAVSDTKRLEALEEENAKLKSSWPNRCWIVAALRDVRPTVSL